MNSPTEPETTDSEQRKLAIDPRYSFIVQAPAGSGKTGLLVQRYLRLLAEVTRPESIVAMTFTRKAAAEMKERIQDVLTKVQSDWEPENDYEQLTRKLGLAALENDRKRGWNLISDTSRLHIQTIDALCALLTRQMPIVSVFGGISNVVEDARELYHLAARRTLQKLSEGEEDQRALFVEVSLYFDNDIATVEGQVARMLQKRDQWRFLTNEEINDSIVASFCRLLGLAHDELIELFREKSTVDFTEVTRAAIRALGTPEEPSDLLYWLDYRIEHLLVDEFQDTSRAQYDLIEALTAQWSEGDGHTLFVVGDPMQSIYRFREADVSLYLDCWQRKRLGSVRLQPILLTTNYRSTPEIVEWVRTVLEPVMSEDDVQHATVKFQPARANRPSGGVMPQLFPFIDDDGRREADEIVRLVARARKPGETAILVRSRSHIFNILPALRRSGIAYEAVEIDELSGQQHILDVIALTRAICHLADRISWLACLRAPWCGLTLQDLSILAEREENRAILDLLTDPERIGALPAASRMRGVRVAEILSAAVSKVQRVPLRTLVEQTWIALGGPAILAEPNQQEDVYAYLGLIEKFEEGGIIRDFSLLNERLECLYARPKVSTDCVRVMTIHQAKGLEFATVILPKLGSPPKNTDSELLLWTEVRGADEDVHLAIAAQPQKGGSDARYDAVRDEIKLKERNELQRLFYVACTRAKNELYLLGNVKSNKAKTQCNKASSNTFLGMIWPSVVNGFESAFRRREPIQRALFQESKPSSTTLRRLPENWRAPKLDRSFEWRTPFRRTTASARKVSYEWVSDTGRHIGTVVHALIQRIAADGVGNWPSERLKQLGPFLRSELARLGVPSVERARAVEKVEQALANTLQCERGRWMFERRAEAYSEWPISGRVGDQLIIGVVDRAFRDDLGQFWIVDFKTSEHQGAGLDRFLDEEQRRYHSQMEAYAVLASRLKRGPIWLGLYFPLLDAWREWPFRTETGAVAI